MERASAAARIDWVDYAKGFCIILVVMMHSTLGVGAAIGETGWMGAIVAFAAPFRMPDFFMISGLFLANVINRDWRLYLDRKLVHFFYFYALWLTIQFALKLPSFAGEYGWNEALLMYPMAYLQPFGTLWFIYILPIFFVLTKLLHQFKVPWQVTLAVAAIAQIATIHTGWLLLDETAGRFVFFFAGYIFASKIFELAAWVRANALKALALLALWGLVNGTVVFAGYSQLPFVSLGLGALGAFAVICVSALLADVHRLGFLRYCGQRSIAVYLAFFFPMAVTRTVLIKLGVVPDAGTLSLLVTSAAVVGPLILWWLIEKTGFGAFLFERPQWAYIARSPRAAAEPAQ
ncbi:acyltransferase [Rhodobacteraceae bacterium RKSG542]|uniref:acyltransferase family protein n=1 Tax=Pseudovibrio flavus TaxID=2529854 RepID=UPI0012BC044E|nr:acyltransferase family protein [Pseudovibrio flavus]MTI18513.1 acyltransferase [Pseudovibrio flavus]